MNRHALAVRQWWAVPVALALLVLVCKAAGTVEVPVPSLTNSLNGAPLAHFTPLLAVIAVMYCVERRLADAESTAVVPVRLLDQGAVLLTGALALAAGASAGMAVARNVLVLLALALLVRRAANEAAGTAVALLYLVVDLALGRTRTPDGLDAHTWWAVTLYPSSSAAAWTVCVAALLLALTVAFPRYASGR
ncbi:hypothetical protein OG599_15665 [Streptomyces sp. NBC_01335]|uniref:hypothetical protein n=1 Tax=Streptomyces sp. NBC_01335 TaxID=2903828 RepID=UPI002E1021EF|nr:hypothetical protein OG599_15665 [Streptomyces sp. NBC_01335]